MTLHPLLKTYIDSLVPPDSTISSVECEVEDQGRFTIWTGSQRIEGHWHKLSPENVRKGILDTINNWVWNSNELKTVRKEIGEWDSKDSKSSMEIINEIQRSYKDYLESLPQITVLAEDAYKRLMDPEYQRKVLKFRREHWLNKMTEPLKKLRELGMTPDDTFKSLGDWIAKIPVKQEEKPIGDLFIEMAKRNQEARKEQAVQWFEELRYRLVNGTYRHNEWEWHYDGKSIAVQYLPTGAWAYLPADIEKAAAVAKEFGLVRMKPRVHYETKEEHWYPEGDSRLQDGRLVPVE